MSFLGRVYGQTDKVELGGGYYVAVKRFLSVAETARAEAVRMSKDIRSEVDNDSKRATSVITVDQQAYNVEIMVAAIDDWNLDDDNGPLPLPPYIPGKPTGDDPANRVRRESVGRLPDFAVKRILTKIKENEEAGLDPESLAAFPGESEGAPEQA